MCLLVTTIPISRCVVVFIRDLQPLITMIGYDDRGVLPTTAEYFNKPLQTVYLSVEDRYTAKCWLRLFGKVERDDSVI